MGHVWCSPSPFPNPLRLQSALLQHIHPMVRCPYIHQSTSMQLLPVQWLQHMHQMVTSSRFQHLDGSDMCQSVNISLLMAMLAAFFAFFLPCLFPLDDCLTSIAITHTRSYRLVVQLVLQVCCVLCRTCTEVENLAVQLKGCLNDVAKQSHMSSTLQTV